MKQTIDWDGQTLPPLPAKKATPEAIGHFLERLEKLLKRS